MCKRLEIMKTTLRYLLIVIGLVSVLSVCAQSTAQLPQAQMQSTSGMVYSGSNLPQAAVTGAYVTGSTPGSYSPAYIKGGGKPRKADLNGNGIDDDEEVDDDDWGETGDPYWTPIGDAMIPLALLACAYVLARAFRKKRVRGR